MTHYGPWPNSKDPRLTPSFELGLQTSLGSVLQLDYKVFLFYIKYNYSMKNKLHKNLMAHAPYLKIFTTHEIWPIMFTMHLIHHHIQSSIKQAQHINIYAQTHDKSDFIMSKPLMRNCTFFRIPWTNSMTGLGSNPIGQTIWPSHRMRCSWKNPKRATRLTSANQLN